MRLPERVICISTDGMIIWHTWVVDSTRIHLKCIRVSLSLVANYHKVSWNCVKMLVHAFDNKIDLIMVLDNDNVEKRKVLSEQNKANNKIPSEKRNSQNTNTILFWSPSRNHGVVFHWPVSIHNHDSKKKYTGCGKTWPLFWRKIGIMNTKNTHLAEVEYEEGTQGWNFALFSERSWMLVVAILLCGIPMYYLFCTPIAFIIRTFVYSHETCHHSEIRDAFHPVGFDYHARVCHIKGYSWSFIIHNLI